MNETDNTANPKPAFSAPQVLVDIINKGEKVSYPAHKTFINEGDPIDHVYCVAEGTVILSRYSVGGERQILAFLFPGDFIGILSQDRFMVAAETLSAASLWRIDRNDMDKAFVASPDVSHAVCAILSRDVRGAVELTFTIGRKSAMARLASFLIYLCLRQGSFPRPGAMVDLPMGRQDIADFLGLTIETVSRSFTKLKDSGAIRLHGASHVEIHDLSALRAAADLVDA